MLTATILFLAGAALYSAALAVFHLVKPFFYTPIYKFLPLNTKL